jgi:hypothetical protein
MFLFIPGSKRQKRAVVHVGDDYDVDTVEMSPSHQQMEEDGVPFPQMVAVGTVSTLAIQHRGNCPLLTVLLYYCSRTSMIWTETGRRPSNCCLTVMIPTKRTRCLQRMNMMTTF